MFVSMILWMHSVLLGLTYMYFAYAILLNITKSQKKHILMHPIIPALISLLHSFWNTCYTYKSKVLYHFCCKIHTQMYLKNGVTYEYLMRCLQGLKRFAFQKRGRRRVWLPNVGRLTIHKSRKYSKILAIKKRSSL